MRVEVTYIPRHHKAGPIQTRKRVITGLNLGHAKRRFNRRFPRQLLLSLREAPKRRPKRA